MCQGHEVLGLVGGVAEHDTLVTGTDVQVGLADVDTTGNVRRLLVDPDKDLAVVAVQALRLDRREVVLVRVEADLPDLCTDDGLVVDVAGGRDLTEDHDHVVLRGGLAGDLGVRVGRQTRIEDGIGDLVSELVGVSLVDRLGREEEVTFFGGDFGCHGSRIVR